MTYSNSWRNLWLLHKLQNECALSVENIVDVLDRFTQKLRNIFDELKEVLSDCIDTLRRLNKYKAVFEYYKVERTNTKGYVANMRPHCRSNC